MATKAEIWTAASRPATAMNGAPGSRRVRRPRKTIASDTAAVTAAMRPAVVRYPWPVARSTWSRACDGTSSR